MSDTATPDARDAPTPPGPAGHPVVGNTLQFLRDPFAFYDQMETHGDVVGYSIAGDDFVTVLHPDAVERILVSEAANYRKADVLRNSGVDFIENGLLLAEGEAWRDQRTALQPMFFRERIATYGDTMARFAADRAEGWSDGQVVDVTDESSALALEILSKTLLDTETAAQRETVRRAARAVQDRGDASGVSAFLPDWVPTPTNLRFRRAVDDFERVVGTLVSERRGDAGDRDDLLSLLLAADMDPEALRDQLVTFLFAGHETTSLALTYTLLLLATNPGPAERLRAELDEVLGDGRASVADVTRLTYTEQVLRESMRRYPPAYVLFRQPTTDVTVRGYRIPAGTNLTLPQFKIHVDERWWDDPLEFRPERFAEEDPDRPEYAYFPFGGGPRHCIGMRFAMLELKLVLAELARRYEFEAVSDSDPELRAAVTLQPENPVRLRVHER